MNAAIAYSVYFCPKWKIIRVYVTMSLFNFPSTRLPKAKRLTLLRLRLSEIFQSLQVDDLHWVLHVHASFGDLDPISRSKGPKVKLQVVIFEQVLSRYCSHFVCLYILTIWCTEWFLWLCWMSASFQTPQDLVLAFFETVPGKSFTHCTAVTTTWSVILSIHAHCTDPDQVWRSQWWLESCGFLTILLQSSSALY